MYYDHEPTLELILNPRPIPGLPEAVHDVDAVGTRTRLLLRFRLTSPKIQQAFLAVLGAQEGDVIAQARRDRGENAIKLDVQLISVIHIFISIQDATDNSDVPRVLARAQKLVRDRPEVLSLWFEFEPEALADFRELWKRNRIQFEPVYRYRGQDVIRGTKQVQVDYTLGMEVEQWLKNHQIGPDDPILQDHLNQIARSLDGNIRESIYADDTSVASYFMSVSNLLVGTVFEPAAQLGFEDFVNKFKSYDLMMLAEYLRPHGVTVHDIKSGEEVTARYEGKEKARITGADIGFSLLDVMGSVSDENRERSLEARSNTIGIGFSKGVGEQYYKARWVRVYKRAAGMEKKRLTQFSTVVLGRGKQSGYLKDSPFPQTYTTVVVDRSIDRLLNQEDYVARLLAERRDQVKERRKREEAVQKLEQEYRAKLVEVGLEGGKRFSQLVLSDDYPNAVERRGHANGIRGVYHHILAVGWAWKPPDPNEIPSRDRDVQETVRQAAESKARRDAANVKASQDQRADFDRVLSDYAPRLKEARKWVEEAQSIIDRTDEEMRKVLGH
jgi:hypothetical protein